MNQGSNQQVMQICSIRQMPLAITKMIYSSYLASSKQTIIGGKMLGSSARPVALIATIKQIVKNDKSLLALLKALEKTFTPIALTMISSHRNNNDALAIIGSMAAVILLKMFFIIPIRHLLPLLKSESTKVRTYMLSGIACTLLQASLNAITIIAGTRLIVGDDSINTETKLTLAAAHGLDLCAIYFRMLLIFNKRIVAVCLITAIAGLMQVLFVGVSMLSASININAHMRGILVYALIKLFGLGGYYAATRTPLVDQETITGQRLGKSLLKFYQRSLGLLIPRYLTKLNEVALLSHPTNELQLISHKKPSPTR